MYFTAIGITADYVNESQIVLVHEHKIYERFMGELIASHKKSFHISGTSRIFVHYFLCFIARDLFINNIGKSFNVRFRRSQNWYNLLDSRNSTASVTSPLYSTHPLSSNNHNYHYDEPTTH